LAEKEIFDTWLGPLPVLLAAEAADDRLTAVWADILWAQYVSSHGSSSSGEGSLLRGEKYPPHFAQRWKGRLENKLHLSDKATGPPESSQRLWSCEAPQSGQRPERPTGGFGVTEGNLYSIIQDRKLTLVVAASPYVGYRVVDEELVTQHRGPIGLASVPREGFHSGSRGFSSSLLDCSVSDGRIGLIQG